MPIQRALTSSDRPHASGLSRGRRVGPSIIRTTPQAGRYSLPHPVTGVTEPRRCGLLSCRLRRGGADVNAATPSELGASLRGSLTRGQAHLLLFSAYFGFGSLLQVFPPLLGSIQQEFAVDHRTASLVMTSKADEIEPPRHRGSPILSSRWNWPKWSESRRSASCSRGLRDRSQS